MDGHAFGRNNRRCRIILPCQAWLRDHPSPQVFSGWTCNLGEGGACLDLSFDLTDGFFPGSLLFLTVQFEEDQLPLEAEVVWVGPPSPPVGIQHGVAFPRLTPDQRQRLQALSQRYGRCWYSQIPRRPRQSLGGSSGGLCVLFKGDLKPGVRAEDAKDRLAHLLQVDDATLEDLLWGGAEVCVVKHGLDRAMAERYVAAFEAAGALCRVEADSPRKPAKFSQADVQRIADEGLGDESNPRRWAPHWGSRSVRSYAIWAAIGLLLLGGGLGLLQSRGILRIPGFEEALPNTQTEKRLPAMARPKPKGTSNRSRTGAMRSPVR